MSAQKEEIGGNIMAFDGLVISALTDEFARCLTGGRINKIYQPESDELILTIKNNGNNYRLLLSASASLPLAYLTENNKNNPAIAPNFCMLLRKHINGGRILSVTQPTLERIIVFEIEHLNDLGDICTKKLIVELMGKHSNIIFAKPDNTIIDSIKHISLNVSSVREVLPGRTWFIPDTQNKHNPLTIDKENFEQTVMTKPVPTAKAIYTSLTGISPAVAEEIAFRANVDSAVSPAGLSEAEKTAVYEQFELLMNDIRSHVYTPNVIMKNGEPSDFSVTAQTRYLAFNKAGEEPVYTSTVFDSISALLEYYYAAKSTVTRIRQKSSDLRRIVSTALERNLKKYDLQMKQMKDTEKRDKYKVYGELINAYGYGLEPGAKSLTCLNYYTNEDITIPLDTQLTAQENAVKYFDRYNKLKRTFEALTELIEETKKEIEHLESISTALDIALYEDDLVEIKEELMNFGYVRRKNTGKNQKKQKITSKPMHYISSDGFHIYVGKNNLQNEEVTFKYADGGDWWFHAKGVPGSHVIVKTEGKELPDRTFEEAGKLAAYYSKNRDAQKVEIDYIQRKHVKKGAGGIPGFVIYHTNYSLLIEPDIQGLEQVK
jgi:predicted ribosome quality control (RQC) complex YloA/Tae2 family protein